MGARRRKPDNLKPRKPRPDTPGGLLARKSDRLDWQRFNFLENLLIFCAQKTRRAPAESGVQFGIRSAVRDDGVCLLFKIDRQPDSLMPAGGPRPDYLVVHISRQHGCLCTIVEMKGKDHHKAEHAIDQIKALWERLRAEVSEHVPGALRRHVRYQGVILTPPNVQVPFRKLEETSKQLVIAVLSYPQTFDLYDYVRRPLEYGRERYEHRPAGASDQYEFNALEAVLACGGLPKRLDVKCCENEVEGAPPRHKGLWLDFANPGNDNCEERGLDGDEDDFVRLLVTPKRLRFVHEERSADFVAFLRQALQARKLPHDGLFGPCT
ncbi:MAG TPA: hypothetical protein VFS43_10745 [Polyangiaceae bacterium]|nr:hypothetical protein [Polyangiaceae bacterium]